MTRRGAFATADLAPALLAVGGLVAYAVRLHLGPVEVLRWGVGMVALWGPMVGLVYLVVGREAPERVSRLTFALIAGYALTTTLYFGVCAVWSHWAFYPIQCLIAGAVVYLAVRGGAESAWRRRGPVGVDWTLVLLIVTTLFLFARYQVPYKADAKDGSVRIAACLEQTYFVGQAYELARHTPPVQQACQAGVAERAYHLLPHVAAMLTARFAGQGDFMHAHLVYHYAMLTVLACLGLYSIAERLTGARAAGHVAVGLLVIFAIPMPPLSTSTIGYFYFNLFPLASSLLEPVVVTSPQMYSGVVVTFGVLLGVVLMCRRLVEGGIGALAMTTGLLVAAMCRFRVQVFLPLAPGFLVVLGLFWWRGRSRAAVLAAGVMTVVTAGLLYAETRLPGYLHDTSSLRVGFYPGYSAFMNDWPFSTRVEARLRWLLSHEAFDLLWPPITMATFTLLNAIGVPILIATAWFVSARRRWREFGPFAFLAVWLVAGSVVGSQMLKVGYDSYSVGGQMLLHVGWYLLPLLAVGLWKAGAWVAGVLKWGRGVRVAVGACLVVVAVVVQLRRGPSELERFFAGLSVSLSRNDWRSLEYLREHTPSDSVVLSREHLEPNAAIYPGMAGRAAYVAYVKNTVELLPSGKEVAGRSRLEIVEEIYASSWPARVRELIEESHATHLVEFASHPLKIGPRKFLRTVWESGGDGERVRILRYVPGPREATTMPASGPAGPRP